MHTHKNTHALSRSLSLSHTHTHTHIHAYAHTHAYTKQACILDCLFLVLSVQKEHYNSELALRLLGRFAETEVERALKLLREKVCMSCACIYVSVGEFCACEFTYISLRRC